MKRLFILALLASTAWGQQTPPTAIGNWPISGAPSSTTFLRGDGSWSTPSGAGGGTPGGSDTQVQFNHPAGTFAGSPLFVFDNAGKITLTINSLGLATGPAVELVNTTAATNGIRQQLSPNLRLQGSGWKTTATAGPMTTEWRIYNFVATDNTTPESYLYFDSQTNGGTSPGAAWTNRMLLWDGEPGAFSAWLMVPNVKVSGTGGKGVLELATQSAGPSLNPGTNSNWLYSNSAGHFVWKDSAGVTHDPQNATNITAGVLATANGGVPIGGTTGQTLSKTSNADNAVGWATPAGGGNVSNVGTPTNGQIAQWTSSTAIQGVNTTGTAGTSVVLATSPTLVTPVLGTPTSGNLANCTFPTLNQDTTGSAASVSISGQAGDILFTGITTVNRTKTVRNADDTILELGGSYTPSGSWTNMTLINPTIGNATTQGFGIVNSFGQTSTITPSGTAGAFTFTLPGDNTTLVGTTEQATLSAKVIIDPVIGNTTTQGFRMRNAASNLDTILPHSGAGNPTLTLPGTTGTLALTSDITAPSDTAYASSWNGITNIAPSKNAVYDQIHAFTTVTDGKVNVLDQGTGITNTNSSGVVQTPITAPSGTIVGTSDTQTLTNKAIQPRTASTTTSATPTPNADTTDLYILTALTDATATFGAPTGSPTAGQRLMIRITDSGGPRTLAWNSGTGGYSAATGVLDLPLTTTASKTMYLLFIYNATGTAKWNLLAKLDGF